MANLPGGWILRNGQPEPSPETITAACREFQAGWTPEEEQKRTVAHMDDVPEIIEGRILTFEPQTVVTNAGRILE